MKYERVYMIKNLKKYLIFSVGIMLICSLASCQSPPDRSKVTPIITPTSQKAEQIETKTDEIKQIKESTDIEALPIEEVRKNTPKRLVTTLDNNHRTLEIDADICIPDVKELPILLVEPLKLNDQQKERILTKILGKDYKQFRLIDQEDEVYSDDNYWFHIGSGSEYIVFTNGSSDYDAKGIKGYTEEQLNRYEKLAKQMVELVDLPAELTQYAIKTKEPMQLKEDAYVYTLCSIKYQQWHYGIPVLTSKKHVSRKFASHEAGIEAKIGRNEVVDLFIILSQVKKVEETYTDMISLEQALKVVEKELPQIRGRIGKINNISIQYVPVITDNFTTENPVWRLVPCYEFSSGNNYSMGIYYSISISAIDGSVLYHSVNPRD